MADERKQLLREDLEAMRHEFGADVWHRYGHPFGLDDDLYQVRQIEWMGFNLDIGPRFGAYHRPTPRRYTASSNSIEADTTQGQNSIMGFGPLIMKEG